VAEECGSKEASAGIQHQAAACKASKQHSSQDKQPFELIQWRVVAEEGSSKEASVGIQHQAAACIRKVQAAQQHQSEEPKYTQCLN
jgi:hypothetical protein